MTQPIPGRFIPAEFLTAHHYIFGQLKVTQSGLMGMMSDITSSYLEMNEASLALIHKPDEVVSYAPVLNIVRAQVVVVCLGKRDYLGLQGVVRSGFQRPQPYSVQATTASYDVRGTIERAGRLEFPALMSEGTNAFILVFDARLTAPLFPALNLQTPIMLLNRNYLESLAVLPRTEG